MQVEDIKEADDSLNQQLSLLEKKEKQILGHVLNNNINNHIRFVVN